GRQQRVERVRLDVESHDEAISESCLLDLEVLCQEVQFGFERALVLTEVFERHPQKIAETHQRAIRGVDVSTHQRGNGVKRVEEKVRLELMLERGHPGFDELGFEL